MNSMKRAFLTLGLMATSSLAIAGSGYRYLGVEEEIQQHSNWCWAASSVDILKFYGKSRTQCSVVNWAYGRTDACTSAPFYWSSSANTPNAMYGSNGSIQAILSNSGVYSTGQAYASSWNTLVNDVNAGRPFVIRFGWYSGGGHFVVGYGYYDLQGTQTVGYMNPWPGEGYTWSTYAWTVNAAYDHSWTHTLRTYR